MQWAIADSTMTFLSRRRLPYNAARVSVAVILTWYIYAYISLPSSSAAHHNDVSEQSSRIKVHQDKVSPLHEKKVQNATNIKMAAVFARRRERIDQICSKQLKNNSTIKAEKTKADEFIIVLEDPQFIFCSVENVASTMWRKIFLYMTQCIGSESPFEIPDHMADDHRKWPRHCGIKFLKDYGGSERRKVLRHFTKVMWARNPVTRLIAAWQSKLISGNDAYYAKKFGSQIIKDFRENAKSSVIEKGFPVRVDEFFSYLLREGQKNEQNDEQWLPYNLACSPCSINYDYIGQYEHLEAEAQYVLEKLQIGSNIAPEVYKSESTSADVQWIEEEANNLPAHFLEGIRQRYQLDYQLFGY